jgi:hypothetical protein
MILTFAEDYTSNVVLDSELISSPTSGFYYNSGVHSSVTVDNLLHFLPKLEFTFSDYSASVTYSKYKDSNKKSDIVVDGGIIYESLLDNNVGNTPASSPTYWLVTNIDSLRLKSFISSVEEEVLTNLKLTRNLIDSQYLYNIDENVQDTVLAGDFSAWVFEPKGSDYVKFRINQMALQANTASPVDISVINQGQLITTLNITPNNGILQFDNFGYEFSGFGRFIFAFPSQSVKISYGFIDPLKYKGFVAYPVVGTGSTVEGADYSYSTASNGLNFNITTFLDSAEYVSNNLIDFAKFIQATFELKALNMFRTNPYNASNRNQRIQINEKQLLIETKNLDGLTVAKKWRDEKRTALKRIGRTFDLQLLGDNNDEFEIEINSI